MMADGCEGPAMPCCYGRTLRRRSIGLEHLYLLIASASNEFPVSCPAHALDYVVMRLALPLLFPRRQVPHFYDAVSTSRGEVIKTLGVLREGVYAVDMSWLEIAQEGLREHPLDLGSVECSGVFSRTFEWMEIRV